MIKNIDLLVLLLHSNQNWVLLPLLGGGAACADECDDDHHHHGDGAHRHHDHHQQVAALLRRGAAMGGTHLTDGWLWQRSEKNSYLERQTGSQTAKWT